MPSVIIPAWNEEAVIERCLQSVLAEPRPPNLEAIVVCNGCSDETARIARDVDSAVTVIETEVTSKTHALNLGDEYASSFPRMYLDADIELGPGALQATFQALRGSVLAAAPRPRFDVSASTLLVKMFYSAWSRSPFFNESMIGVGVYALAEEGRSRFDRFPPIIADDGFVRLQFRADERLSISAVHFTMMAPRSTRELIPMKRRVMAGETELDQKFPELAANEEHNRTAGFWNALRSPRLWLCFLVYGYYQIRIRGGLPDVEPGPNTVSWGQDESSRSG